MRNIVGNVRWVSCYVVLTRTRRAKLWSPEAVCWFQKDAYQLAKDRRALAIEYGETIDIRVVQDRLEMDLVAVTGRAF